MACVPVVPLCVFVFFSNTPQGTLLKMTFTDDCIIESLKGYLVEWWSYWMVKLLIRCLYDWLHGPMLWCSDWFDDLMSPSSSSSSSPTWCWMMSCFMILMKMLLIWALTDFWTSTWGGKVRRASRWSGDTCLIACHFWNLANYGFLEIKHYPTIWK